MKKQILLLAGAAVMLASCGSNEPKQEGPTQAQVDSTVNAAVAAREAANQATADSTLKAMEAEKAAAMAKEMEGSHKMKKTTKTTTTKVEKTETPPPPPPQGGLRGHSDQTQSAPSTSDKPQGGGLRKHSDQGK